MPRAKKSRQPLSSRRCAECGAEFTPNTGLQRYCDAHKNRHQAQATNLRAESASQRPPAYYATKRCAEPGCEVEFEPTSGSQRYCDEHRGRAWDRHHPEVVRESARRSQRRYRHRQAFGDPDIYDVMVARYGERCAICGAPPSQKGFHLAVDHNHATEKLRGLLCGSCNTGLGYFKDEPARLIAAAQYLSGELLA